MARFEGFWGLQVVPGKTFSQIAPASFRVSMAALADNADDSSRTTVRVIVDKRSFVLCSLRPGKVDQQPLDVTFVEGEEVSFLVKGKHTVHLTGNYLSKEDGEDDEEELQAFLNGHAKLNGATTPKDKARAELMSLMDEDLPSDTDDESFEEEGSDDDEDEDEDEDENEKEADESEEEEEEEEEDEDEEEEEEEEEEKSAKSNAKPEKAKKKVKFADQQPAESKPAVNGKVKEEKKAKEQPKPAEAEKKQPEKSNEQTKPVEAEKKESAKPKKRAAEEEKGSVDKKTKTEQPKETEPEVKDFSKLNLKDTKVGEGRAVKNGDKVGIRYIGRLQNGKVFDKNVSGKPLFINVGKQEVVKGLDTALVGMRLGGERTVRIPHHLAYGKKGLPPVIPKNANLQFDIKLISLS